MALLTPPPTPIIQRGDRTTFANRVDAFITWLITFVSQMLTLVSSLNTLAAGGAYSIPYVIDLSSTVDSDPTAGLLRFNAAIQNAATTIYLDLLGSDGIDYTSIIDIFDASTSAAKGSIRLVKMGDPTKFLTFSVTGRTTATGYRKLTLVNTGGSSASPFAAGDSVVLQFQRNGDKGDLGQPGFSNMVVLRSTQSWTPPAGMTRAKITVINGGDGGYSSSSTTNYAAGGKGGDYSISVRAVSSAVTYTATVGGGGTGNNTGNNTTSNPGGTSSFSGSGLTTLTSANGDIAASGEAGSQSPALNFSYGGGSLYASRGVGGAGSQIGQGGSGSVNSGMSSAGAAGAIIIEY
jgi:hypothetical protein